MQPCLRFCGKIASLHPNLERERDGEEVASLENICGDGGPAYIERA